MIVTVLTSLDQSRKARYRQKNTSISQSIAETAVIRNAELMKQIQNIEDEITRPETSLYIILQIEKDKTTEMIYLPVDQCPVSTS